MLHLLLKLMLYFINVKKTNDVQLYKTILGLESMRFSFCFQFRIQRKHLKNRLTFKKKETKKLIKIFRKSQKQQNKRRLLALFKRSEILLILIITNKCKFLKIFRLKKNYF